MKGQPEEDVTRPERIVILGYPFQIRWDYDRASRLSPSLDTWWDMGATDVQRQILHVRAVESGEHQLRDTLLHEVIHACIRMTAQKDRFKEMEGEDHPEEPLVYALATALLGVLRSNPSVVTYLTQPIKSDGDTVGEE